MDKEQIEKNMLADLKEVSRVREALAALAEQKKQALKKWEEEHSELLNNIQVMSEELERWEAEARNGAISLYDLTKEKKLPGGMGIRVTQVLEYEDSKALAWCKEHDMALTFDKTAFKKIAKADKLDFVKYSEAVTATIPTRIEVD